jgi:hypothetical protein
VVPGKTGVEASRLRGRLAYGFAGVDPICKVSRRLPAHTVGGAMSDCLHCDINQLVQERMERGEVDLAELTSMVAESLADLILVAPEIDQAKLLADAIAQLGQTLLEKSGAVEGDPSRATH